MHFLDAGSPGPRCPPGQDGQGGQGGQGKLDGFLGATGPALLHRAPGHTGSTGLAGVPGKATGDLTLYHTCITHGTAI